MNFIYKIRYFIYLLIIILVSGYLISLIYGYKINWITKKFEKTSIIYLASLPTDVNVYYNNYYLSDTTPLKIINVFPGRYDIRIENNLYETWEKSYNVKSDLVSQDSDIILILKKIIEVNMTDAEAKFYEKVLVDQEKIKNEKLGILIKNLNEIYFNDIFVTRFSDEIKNIVWYPDKKHFIYQVGNKINFMDSDGSNIKNLAILPGNEKSEFIASENGMYLIYKYQNTLTKIKITEIKSLLTEKYINRATRIIK